MPKKRVTRKAKKDSTVINDEIDFNSLTLQAQQCHVIDKVNKLGVGIDKDDLSVEEQNCFREMFDDIMMLKTNETEIDWLKDDPY